MARMFPPGMISKMAEKTVTSDPMLKFLILIIDLVQLPYVVSTLGVALSRNNHVPSCPI